MFLNYRSTEYFENIKYVRYTYWGRGQRFENDKNFVTFPIIPHTFHTHFHIWINYILCYSNLFHVSSEPSSYSSFPTLKVQLVNYCDVVNFYKAFSFQEASSNNSISFDRWIQMFIRNRENLRKFRRLVFENEPEYKSII